MGVELFKRWMRPFRLRRRLRPYLPNGGRDHQFAVVGSAKIREAVEMHREGCKITLFLADGEQMKDDLLYYGIYRRRLPTVLDLFARTDHSVRSAVAYLVGGTDYKSDHLVFCSTQPDALLIPDPDFFTHEGYDDVRRHLLSHQRPWIERADTIVWRGSTTGEGNLLSADLDDTAPSLRPRVRLCGLLKRVPDTDVKLHQVVHSDDPAIDEARLRTAGLLGEYVPQETWLDRKFAIDIDGHTNAWQNFFLRLLLGCCVLKVASPRGWRQWYYDRLKPWEHFVPVRADLSDLIERIDWCRSHASECAAIAANGQALALPMTWARESADAVERINRRLGGRGYP